MSRVVEATLNEAVVVAVILLEPKEIAFPVMFRLVVVAFENTPVEADVAPIEVPFIVPPVMTAEVRVEEALETKPPE